MIVAIFYEHVSREYQSCLNLKNKLDLDENIVKIFSLHFEIDAFYKWAQSVSIDIIIVPFAYKKTSIRYLYSFLNKKPQVKIINLHHEQIAAPFDEHTLLPQDDYVKNTMYHVAWTCGFKNKLIDLGIKEELISITGNIRLDNSFVSNISRYQVASDFHLDPNKKWILICESGAEIYSKVEIQSINKKKKINSEDLKTRNLLISKALKKTIDDLNGIDENILKEYEIIYRPHPGKSIDNKKLKSGIKIINNYSVYDWFSLIHLCISRTSTVLFEAEAYGVNVVRYDPVDYPQKLTPRGLSNYDVINSLFELKEYLINLSNTYKQKCMNYVDYIGATDGKNTDRLVGFIKSIFENNKNELIPICLTAKRYIIRKQISNYIIRKLFKLTLAKKLIPSLKIFEKDIPPDWIKKNG